MMKKTLLIAAFLLALPLSSEAARQSVTQITGTQASIGALKTQVNTRFDATDDNFIELYDGKADKTAAVRYWSDWPTTSPNNVLAVGTIVAYDGALYKVIQQITKTGSTADPATLTAYFTEVGAGDNLGSATAADVAALFTTGTGDCLGANGQLVACSGGSGTDDQTASEVPFTPNGSIAATNVQAAIQEVRDEAGSGHTEVTLGTDADVLLGLSTQQLTLDSQTANTFFAAPNGSAGDPTFRAIVVADIPTLNQSTTGNAATATALAANPTDCSAGQYATTIAANGNLTCAQVGYSQISSTPTLGTAAALNVGTGANNIPQLNSSGELPYTIPQLTSLQTASGLTSGDLHLGTFTGTTIADSSTVKTAFQALETAVEGKQASDADLTDLADGSLTGTKVGFADTDNLWTATNVQAALEELNDSINAGAPNGTGAKVHWSQLLGVPAGFADGSDDGSGGGITHATSDGTYYASRNGAWSAITSGNYTLGMTLTANTAVTLPTSGTLVAADVSSTLTNKTFDVEGTGNNITIVDKVWFAAAGCNNTTATSFYDLHTSAVPAVACVTTASGPTKGVLDFDPDADESAMVSLMLPSDATELTSGDGVDVTIKYTTAATTGNVVWAVDTQCRADSETDDSTSWNASTVTDAAKGTANQLNDASLNDITMTNCAAGELLHLRVRRDADNASDTTTGDARLIGAEVTIRRLQ